MPHETSNRFALWSLIFALWRATLTAPHHNTVLPQRTCKLRSVLRLLPICPAILRPGSTREGVADDPMDPCCRCDLEPCVIRPRLWFQRLIVPARAHGSRQLQEHHRHKMPHCQHCC